MSFVPNRSVSRYTNLAVTPNASNRSAPSSARSLMIAGFFAKMIAPGLESSVNAIMVYKSNQPTAIKSLPAPSMHRNVSKLKIYITAA